MPNQLQPNTGYDDDELRRRRHNNWMRPLCGSLFIIFLLFSSITWAILQPHAPRFVFEDTTIYSFNVSARNRIFSPTLRVRVWYHNPNRRMEIFYYNLNVYATYYGREITYNSADLPPLYQGHKDTNVLSPTLFGNNNLLLSYYAIPRLLRDQDNGAFWITVNIFGTLLFRVGAFVSVPFHLRVTCPAYVPFPSSSTRDSGVVVGKAAAAVAVKYPLSRSCAVTVNLMT